MTVRYFAIGLNALAAVHGVFWASGLMGGRAHHRCISGAMFAANFCATFVSLALVGP